MRHLKPYTTLPAARGFTLIEVLVAVLLFSIGLLGVAGLQTAGLKTTNQSYQRTVAITAMRDMADRMRANMTGVRNGYYSAISGNAYTIPACITNSTACSAADLANFDAYQWNNSTSGTLPTLLPSGAGTVTCTPIAGATPPPALPAGSSCTINVQWDGNRVGSSATSCTTGGLICVQMTVIL
jgi:type IV pilus assembly protein PilV